MVFGPSADPTDDPSETSLYLLDAAGTALFPLYLWVIVGNGLRFGQRYLYLAAGLAVASLVTVMATSAWWQAHPYLGAGLLMGLVALPAAAWPVTSMDRRPPSTKR